MAEASSSSSSIGVAGKAVRVDEDSGFKGNQDTYSLPWYFILSLSLSLSLSLPLSLSFSLSLSLSLSLSFSLSL
jgi:hypothetical protein